MLKYVAIMNYKMQRAPEDSALATEAEKYDFIRFSVVDVNGVSRGKVVPGHDVKKYIANGLSCFCGTLGITADGRLEPVCEIERVKDCGYSNATFIPDQATLQLLNWAGDGKFKIAQLLCDSYWLPDMSVQGANTRMLAKNILRDLENFGYSFKCSFEVEFQILDKDMNAITEKSNIVKQDALESTTNLLYELVRAVRGAGVRVEAFHHEYGQSQYELALEPEKGIRAADDVFILKTAIREIFAKHELNVSFLSRPSESNCINGLHMNHSLWNVGNADDNEFFDGHSTSPPGLSEICTQWMAGLLKHSNALTALCCPTINCYRRQDFKFSPKYSNWAIENRTAAFRAKNYGNSGTYVENRICSGACNPYLAIAGTVLAGVAGLRNNLQLEQGQLDKSTQLPTSLKAALEAFNENDTFRKGLGEEFKDWFNMLKEDEFNVLAMSDDESDSDQFSKESNYYKYL